MEIRVQREDKTLTLYPVGPLAADSCGPARDRMMAEVELNRGITDVVVDLRAASLLDSTGIGILMGLRIHLSSRKVTFRLANPSKPALDTIKMMNLGPVFGL